MGLDDDREFVDYVTARLPRLHRAAFLLCGDGHRADDVVQATMTSLYRHWRRARAADNLDAYVHRMLMRHFLDERRHSWSKVLLGRAAPERAAPDQPAFEADNLYTTLRNLPRGQREVLVLRFLCDLSVEDTAAALRCSTGNVKSQTSRGLEAMRRLLASDGSRSLT